MKTTIKILLAVALLSAFFFQFSAFGQGTALTYQGRLNDGTNPANGSYDLRFGLYNAASGGAQQGNAITNSPTGITNGLFTVTLDFGNQFTGADRWLEIGVRINGGGAFTTLAPRQPITSAPYAVRSQSAGAAATATSVTGSVAASQLTGTISSNNIAAGSINGTMLAAGSVTTEKISDGAVTGSKLQMLFQAPLEYTMFDVATGFNVALPHEFGYNVLWSSNGNGYVISDPFAEPGEPDAGVLYMFLNGSLVIVSPPILPGSAHFGESVAEKPGGFLVGAPGAGQVYFVNYVGGFSIPYVGSGSDEYGKSVARTGNGIELVGAPAFSGPVGFGRVYTYGISKPFIDPPSFAIRFGQTMVPAGTNQVAIGASGFAFLYSLVNTGGVYVATLSVPGQDLNSDVSLATFGSDRVVVGGSAAAGLFSTNGTLLATFTDPESGLGQAGFGTAVAALGTDKVAVSAPWRAVSGKTNAGVVYIFNTNGLWIGISRNPAPTDNGFFGRKLTGLGYDLFAAQSLDGGGTVRWCRLASDNKYLPGLGLEPGQKLPALGMTGANTLEFGAGTNKEVNAGKIGYQVFTPDSLDIVGAGTNSSNRKISFFAEGGSTFTGPVSATAFSGSGSNLTSLNAANISSGTLADGRLSANVALRNAANSFTAGSNTFSGSVGIGTISPGVPLQVQGAATWPGAGNPLRGAIYGIQTSGDAFSAGVAGVSQVSGAYGVVGESDTVRTNKSGPAQASVGVGGTSLATNGTGVYGYASAASGLTFGVVGEAPSAEGYAGYFLGRGYFSNNVGIGTTTTGGNKLQINPTFHPATGFGLQVNQSDYGANIQINRTNGQSGFGLIVDNSSTGDANTSLLLVRNNVGSAAQNLFNVRSDGNVGIGVNPTNKLHVNGGVSATAFVTTSDRNAKENFTPVSPLDVLSKVAMLPITTWNFRNMKDGRHMGPMAQDFYTAFGLGGGDTTITSVDPDGVALAAIQGLNEKLESGKQKAETRMETLEQTLQQKETEITELKSQLSELKQLVRSVNEKLNGGRK